MHQDGLLNNNDLFIARVLRRFMLPTILSVLGGTINTLVDSIIVGNVLGDQGLAAINLCTPIFFCQVALGALIGTGAATLSSIAVGQNDGAQSRRYYTLAVMLLAVAGLLFAVAGTALIQPAVRLLGGRGELYHLVYDYAIISMWGAPAKLLLYAPFNYLRVDGRPQLVTVVLLTMTVLNGGLDLLFMAGCGWGMQGAAAASVIASSVAAVLGFLCLRDRHSSFHLSSLKGGNLQFGRILATGSPEALNNFFSMLRVMGLNLLLLNLGGGRLVAVFALLNSMSEFSLALINGVPQTATPLIGVYSGERDTPSIRLIMGKIFRSGLLLVLLFAALTAFCAPWLGRIFGLGAPDMQALAVPALYLFGISLPFAMLNSILTYYYNTMQHIALANLLTSGRLLVFTLLPAWLLAQNGQAAFIWWFFPLSELLTLAMLLLLLPWFRRGKKQLSPVYLLDETLEKEGKTINFSVANRVDSVLECSERISAFCDANDLTPKQSLAVSLALEEMLVIILQKCFTPGENQWVDVRVFQVQGTIGLRIRNGGRPFNPLAYLLEQQAQGEDTLGETLGIAMINKLASTILYQRTFGVNSLMITL